MNINADVKDVNVKNMKKPALVWKWKEFFIASG
jgi:hypothetical protein